MNEHSFISCRDFKRYTKDDVKIIKKRRYTKDFFNVTSIRCSIGCFLESGVR